MSPALPAPPVLQVRLDRLVLQVLLVRLVLWGLQVPPAQLAQQVLLALKVLLGL